MYTDTIAGIATALSNSGISIIRVSGDDSIKIVNRIFSSSKFSDLADAESNYLNYGFIVDSEGKIVDEVLVSLMRHPKSYTREDVVEINCHGGVLVTKKILEMLVKNGARIAEPGEFTKRAFLNGRLDLSQAEAVMDVINSNNEYSLKTGVRQLKGDLRDKIAEIRAELIERIAEIESSLDDPEHFSLEGLQNRLSGIINAQIHVLNSLIASYGNGKIIKNGINTVIVGKPNAGKSSFLNSILGIERAIVTDVAGTTRDVLEENVSVNGISLNIKDTAGIRNTDDVVEKIGVEIAFDSIKDSDLILYVVDSSVALDENDDRIIESILNKKIIVLFNKTDLKSAFSEDELVEKMICLGINRDNIDLIKISAKENKGIDDFRCKVEELFSLGEIEENNELIITSLRQKEALEDAVNSLYLVIDTMNAGMPEDMMTIDMMSAYTSLGRVIGEAVDDDLVNEIFSKFCMGK